MLLLMLLQGVFITYDTEMISTYLYEKDSVSGLLRVFRIFRIFIVSFM